MRRRCPFCNFQEKDAIICEDRVAYAIVSKRPINKYHALVIPKRHFEAFTDLPDHVASSIFLMARRVSAAIRKVCSPDAVSHISDDEITWKRFNLVAHYKFHVIPRYKHDRVEIEWHRERDPGRGVRLRYANELRRILKA